MPEIPPQVSPAPQALPANESASALEMSINQQSLSPAYLPPIPADPGQILSLSQDSWRDNRFEVFSWDRFPEILIFDIVNFDMQARLFKRLAFFCRESRF